MRTELESILVEQALAMARELEAVTDAAPDGAVLAVGEMAAVRLGRELTRVALEAALQRQAAPGREKGAPGRACPCGGRRRVKDKAARAAVTAAGRVALARRSLTCPACGSDGLPGRRPGRPRRLPQPRRRPAGLPGRRELAPSTSPPTAWRSSPASGSTTRRSAATATGRPPAWPPAARPPRPRRPSPRPRGRSSSSPTA